MVCCAVIRHKFLVWLAAHRLPQEALRNYDYYMDTHRLRISVSNMKNANSREQLEHIKTTVLQNLAQLDAAPSAHMAPRPPAHIKARHPLFHTLGMMKFIVVHCVKEVFMMPSAHH